MNEKEKNVEQYNNSLHLIGRITIVLGIIAMVGVPFLMGYLCQVMPQWSGFINGVLSVGLIYIPMGVVEFLVYAPMLGVGGSYLAFLTGNVTNMKIPCVMNSADIAGTKPGTVEHEIISTISVATSAITTTLVIVAGVILLVPLQPIIHSDVLAPAFDNVVPALFGALGLKYFTKSWKITVVPLTLMCLLCIFVPSMINQSSILLIPSGGLALVIAFILNKKDML